MLSRSTTWDEFARKWNKPVHEWLLRHIYLESLKSFRGDKFSANLATFLCSSVAHELVMSVMFRMFRYAIPCFCPCYYNTHHSKRRPWMFLLQMLQIPLILCGGFLKGKRNLPTSQSLYEISLQCSSSLSLSLLSLSISLFPSLLSLQAHELVTSSSGSAWSWVRPCYVFSTAENTSSA